MLCVSRILSVAESFDARKAWPACSTPAYASDDSYEAVVDNFAARRCIQGLDSAVTEYSRFYLDLCENARSMYSQMLFLVKTGVPPLSCVNLTTKVCPVTCDDSSSIVLRRGKSVAILLLRKFEQALVDQGPFVVEMDYFSDLDDYKGGVYKHQDGEALGQIYVQIVGYDATSWILKGFKGPDWGEEGYFRVQKGANECGIEGDTFAINVK